ncbi:hypothetical protein O6P43_018310 [Quillaja saponaria]|uniref:Uncharacterized protein n=1 Tax=Quillaja saponaria TaxID=32244 RepID=A0AAD7LS94_QUISA|nr:hypothetical protein O6P43_018310 [Quillaja saponaria]
MCLTSLMYNVDVNVTLNGILLRRDEDASMRRKLVLAMDVKPTVALRAILVGGIAAFAKIAGAMKAAGGAKMGAAAAAMTAAATAAISSKQEAEDTSKPSSK